MKKYVLPPEFHIVSDPKRLPVVMYFFEFENNLDRDDLSYIWQNLAPRDYKKMEHKIQYSSHMLNNNELMQVEDILENDNLRWMVFKVKQRGMAKYEDKIYSQVGTRDSDTQTSGYEVNFNWPYDYVSFVEMINVDVETMMDNEVIKTATDANIAKLKVPNSVSFERVQDSVDDKIVEKALSTVDKFGDL